MLMTHDSAKFSSKLKSIISNGFKADSRSGDRSIRVGPGPGTAGFGPGIPDDRIIYVFVS